MPEDIYFATTVTVTAGKYTSVQNSPVVDPKNTHRSRYLWLYDYHHWVKKIPRMQGTEGKLCWILSVCFNIYLSVLPTDKEKITRRRTKENIIFISSGRLWPLPDNYLMVEETMISLPSGTRICLIAGVADMRKSFNGLGKQGQHVLNYNPFFGHLFIFRGRRGDTVKILWADGLCLFTKRQEEGNLSGLRYVTAGYPLPARSWQCSLVSWASVSQKHHALTRWQCGKNIIAGL